MLISCKWERVYAHANNEALDERMHLIHTVSPEKSVSARIYATYVNASYDTKREVELNLFNSNMSLNDVKVE